MRVPTLRAMTLLCLAMSPAQARPDFSGTWTFDGARSSQTLPGGGVIIAKLLGDEVTIQQDAGRMSLAIRIGSRRVDAVYALDGSESRNPSSEGGGKPDVDVISRASWEDGKLVIVSTSTSDVQCRSIAVETKRVLWIDGEGRLILDRSGTPVSEVPTSRSVYARAKAADQGRTRVNSRAEVAPPILMSARHG